MNFDKICPHCMCEIVDIGNGKCDMCGKLIGIVENRQYHLRPCTILQGKYMVGEVLGEGGFGVTYVGLDLNLEVKIAIKEFWISEYMTRNSGMSPQVNLLDIESKDSIEKWKSSFISEARYLAKCTKLDGIVSVRDYFQENGTVYIIEEFLQGKTLKEYIEICNGKIPPNVLLPSFKHIMISLYEVHKNGVIHCDISPDNIMVLDEDGRMKLIDFGAARGQEGLHNKNKVVMLKKGYAAEELYRLDGEIGPWTDVYALAATMYKCLTGNTLPDVFSRLQNGFDIRLRDSGIQINEELRCIA